MKIILSSLLAGAVLAWPLAASAQTARPSIRPGLWEHGFTMKSQSGQLESAMNQMKQTMANLPPAQRKMMEDMMARQGVGIGAGGNSVKVCVTPEEAARDEPPQTEGCSQTARRSGNVWQVSFQCKGPPPSSGEGQVTLLSPTAYSGEFDIRTEANGKPERFKMTQNGKWLGADCGNIRSVPGR